MKQPGHQKAMPRYLPTVRAPEHKPTIALGELDHVCWDLLVAFGLGWVAWPGWVVGARGSGASIAHGLRDDGDGEGLIGSFQERCSTPSR